MFIDDNLRARNHAGTDKEKGGFEIFRVEVCEELVCIQALLWESKYGAGMDDEARTDGTIIIVMTPGHFIFASGHVVFSYAATTGPPAVFILAGVLDSIWVVGTDDTVAPIDLLVERDVGDCVTVELLEPLLDLFRVDWWGEIPTGWPRTGGQGDWGKGQVSVCLGESVWAGLKRGWAVGLLRAAAKPFLPKSLGRETDASCRGDRK